MKKLFLMFAVLALVLCMCFSMGAAALAADGPGDETVATLPPSYPGEETTSDPIMDVISAGVKLVLTAISAVITIVVIPFLKKTVIPWLEEKHLRSLIAGLVQGAEQKGDAGQIAKRTKKDYVLGLLRARGIEITEEIDNMVEAAVLGLDDSFAKVVKALIGEDGSPAPQTEPGPAEVPDAGEA